jgi:predicted permease
MTIASVGGGTYAAYRANGGPNGLDFASRYFALSWVVFVRLVVFVFLPAMAFVFVLGALFAAFHVAQAHMDRYFSWVGAVVGVIFLTSYYCRLVHHLRQVAAPQAG